MVRAWASGERLGNEAGWGSLQATANPSEHVLREAFIMALAIREVQ